MRQTETMEQENNRLLGGTRMVLASASPRRSELLRQIGFEPEIIPSQVEEIVTSTEPAQVVMELSAQKAEEVAARIAAEKEIPIVIGSDTVVSIDGKILGKPADREDACRMLSMLQGRKHQVFTGVTLFWEGEGARTESLTFHECTEVEFYPMSRAQIEAYAASGDCDDKAGSYGIQGPCAAHIRGIIGDYNNVVGLPVGRLYQEMHARELI